MAIHIEEVVSNVTKVHLKEWPRDSLGCLRRSTENQQISEVKTRGAQGNEIIPVIPLFLQNAVSALGHKCEGYRASHLRTLSITPGKAWMTHLTREHSHNLLSLYLEDVVQGVKSPCHLFFLTSSHHLSPYMGCPHCPSNESFMHFFPSLHALFHTERDLWCYQ